VSDADVLAAELEAAIEKERLAREAPALERRLAFVEAGIPLDKPYGRLFAEHYDGPLDPDEVTVAWFRTMTDQKPPADVVKRLADRESSERIERYRQALEGVSAPTEDESPETEEGETEDA
jgi:hypothetical protein